MPRAILLRHLQLPAILFAMLAPTSSCFNQPKGPFTGPLSAPVDSLRAATHVWQWRCPATWRAKDGSLITGCLVHFRDTLAYYYADSASDVLAVGWQTEPSGERIMASYDSLTAAYSARYGGGRSCSIRSDTRTIHWTRDTVSTMLYAHTPSPGSRTTVTLRTVRYRGAVDCAEYYPPPFAK
jgi:hypothetical protein